MAFNEFLAAEIEAGKPTKQELFEKLKDNFTDHESRLLSLESGAVTQQPIAFHFYGPYYNGGSTQTEVVVDRVHANITLASGRLMTKNAGTSGTLSVGVDYKRGAGAWTPIFSTQPSIAYTSGDNFVSSNGVLSVTTLLAGDLLRVNITSVQTRASGFVLYLEFTNS